MSWLQREEHQISTTGFAGTSSSPDHYEKNRFERDFVMKRVKELFGEPPKGSYLRWKGYPHDFGTYYELTIYWPVHIDEDKIWKWINKVEDHDWEKEEEELANLWEIRDIEALQEDNKFFDLLDTNE